MKHGFPAILSFFIPGLGQIIKGEVMRGIWFGLGVLLTLPTLIGAFIVWIWCVSDAYNHNSLTAPIETV